MLTQHQEQVSKTLSYALRHRPDVFGLTLDAEGWANLATLLTIMHVRNVDTSKEEIEEIIANSDKKRFELDSDGNAIRATYGHSIAEKVDMGDPTMPPETLFHGTAAETFYSHIEKEGIKPMNRQMVHLSTDVKTADKVAHRHGNLIVVIAIDAKRMWNDGIKFYKTANDGTWLCDFVDSKYFLEVR